MIIVADDDVTMSDWFWPTALLGGPKKRKNASESESGSVVYNDILSVRLWRMFLRDPRVVRRPASQPFRKQSGSAKIETIQCLAINLHASTYLALQGLSTTAAIAAM